MAFFFSEKSYLWPLVQVSREANSTCNRYLPFYYAEHEGTHFTRIIFPIGWYRFESDIQERNVFLFIAGWGKRFEINDDFKMLLPFYYSSTDEYYKKLFLAGYYRSKSDNEIYQNILFLVSKENQTDTGTVEYSSILWSFRHTDNSELVSGYMLYYLIYGFEMQKNRSSNSFNASLLYWQGRKTGEYYSSLFPL